MPDFAYKYFKKKSGLLYYKPIHIGNPLNPLSADGFPGFSYDISTGINWGSTVVYSQIQIAKYMGFSEIYLLGVDYRFSLSAVKKKNVFISEGEKNHFHKDYRKNGISQI